jgi:hypothetical protein
MINNSPNKIDTKRHNLHDKISACDIKTSINKQTNVDCILQKCYFNLSSANSLQSFKKCSQQYY